MSVGWENVDAIGGASHWASRRGNSSGPQQSQMHPMLLASPATPDHDETGRQKKSQGNKESGMRGCA